MANANIASIGRFSSQMLTYLGTQKTVKSVNGTPQNTFKWSSGPTYFPSPGSVSQADLGGGVVGNYSAATYNSTVCYFLSRGTGLLYAQTMTALAIDMANTLGISTQNLLEQSETNGQLLFTDDAYRAFNMFRDPGNQVGIVTAVNNRFSLQAREIRA
jgi:hypothetical protein